MTRTDQKILFTALAFLSVAIKGKANTDVNEQVLRLAGLIEEFVAENIVTSSSLDSIPASEVTDILIDKHLHELREEETTVLPNDKSTLIGLCDRLRHRKAQRTQREFYANASEAKLADMVLKLLDEEIQEPMTGGLS